MSNPITLLPSYAIFLTSLAVIGEPLRSVMKLKSESFARFDVLQVFLLDTFLGGMIAYLVAQPVLQVFNCTTVWVLLMVGAATTGAIYIHRFTHTKELRNAQYGEIVRAKVFSRGILKPAIALGLFVVVLWISLSATANFILDNPYDSALHSLFTSLILEKGSIPVTLEPYAGTAVIYPQGFHVLAAYASLLFNWEPARSVHFLMPLFQSLPILAAYFLGRVIQPKGWLSVSLAFLMGFVTRWPRLLTWGALPFIAGFSLYFVCLGLVILLLQDAEKAKSRCCDWFPIGLLLGYLGATHIVFYQTLAVLMMILLIFKLERGVFRIIETSLKTLFFSIIPLLFPIYQGLRYYGYPGHNINLPADLIGPVALPSLTYLLGEVSRNFLVSDHISPYPLVIIVIILGIAASILIATRFRGRYPNDITYVSWLPAAAAVLTVLLATKELPLIPEGLTNQYELVLIALVHAIFSTSVLHLLLLQKLKAWGHPRIANTTISSRRIAATTVIAIVVWSLVFPYYSLSYDRDYLIGQYNVFDVVTEDSYKLMKWVKENTPRDSVILSAVGTSGSYIPSVSNKVTVPGPHPIWLSASYLRLSDLIRDGELSPEAFKIIQQWNITHVFLDQKVCRSPLAPIYIWSPLALLGNPNFRLEKAFGDALLFKVTYEQSNVIFLDDFERDALNTFGWEQFSRGIGFGNASIGEDPQNSQNRMLVVRAKWSQGSPYIYTIQRKFFLWNSDDAVLFLRMDLNNSFNPPDGVIISIVDETWQERIDISTDDGIVSGNPSTLNILNGSGPYRFEISRLWKTLNGSPLPKVVMIQVHVIDLDGVENVLYLDDFKIEVM